MFSRFYPFFKIWTQYKKRNPIKCLAFPTTDVSDLLIKIKTKYSFPPLSNIEITTKNHHTPFEPNVLANKLLTQGHGTFENPLLLKPMVFKKTIYLMEDGDFKKKIFSTINTNDNINKFHSVREFQKASDPNVTCFTFDELEEEERYYPKGQNFENWILNQSRAMEEEAIESLKKILMKKYNCHDIKELPRTILKGKRHIQEWDGVLYLKSIDTVFLIEAKQRILFAHLDALRERAKGFNNTIKQSKQEEYKLPFKHIQPVAYGTAFPKDLRKDALNRGISIGFPSGDRFEFVASTNDTITK